MEDKLTYEKIAALIARNDFVAAEKLLRKHDISFTQEQKDALQKLLEKQQREKAADIRKRERHMRFEHFWGHHWRRIQALEKGSLCLFFVLACILSPYCRASYIAHLSSWDGPPFQRNIFMEILFSVNLALLGFFFGLNLVKAYTYKSNKKRGWLIALLLVIIAIAIQWWP